MFSRSVDSHGLSDVMESKGVLFIIHRGRIPLNLQIVLATYCIPLTQFPRLQSGMGATQSPHKDNIPTKGSRIMQVISPQLENKLQPFTDYIIEPGPSQLRNSVGQVEVVIFSTLDYSMRKQTLPVSQNHLGARIKVTDVQDCALKVTKVFPNSPAQRLGILAEQYIVGLQQAEFNNLKSFAQALHKILEDKREVLTLGICDHQGVTRLIPVSVSILNEWKSASQGLLGCELAEGWMHRFRTKPRRKSIPEEPKQEKRIQKIEEQERIQMERVQEGEWQEVERKVGSQQVGETLEVTFKGLLKNEYLEDASTICRCKLYDKSCEKCWVEKDGGFHFFNQKTNRIVTIPSSLLLNVG